MIKVCVASSRWDEIGNKCLTWAKNNMPSQSILVSEPELSDVFISVLYGSLVSEEFISKRRCYNFHPGILPQYRGAGAFSWAIINGEKRCGITLHELDVNIDTGPIIDIATFSIEAWDTAETLFEKGMYHIYEKFKQHFECLVLNIKLEPYNPVAQNESLAHTYYRKDLKAQQDLTRFVRAFSFEGKEPAFYTNRYGKKVELKW